MYQKLFGIGFVVDDLLVGIKNRGFIGILGSIVLKIVNIVIAVIIIGIATSTVAKGKNGCKLRKMGIFVSNFEKYFVVWGCIF